MSANWTAFVAAQVLTASQLNGVVDNFQDIAIFNESQASGTQGGAFTSGSYAKRTLNTTVVNNITGCTLSSSVVSLPAGTYYAVGYAPAFRVADHKARLQNTTAATTIQLGTNAMSGTVDDYASNLSIVAAVFTLSVTSNVELQHRCGTTRATNGYGRACSFGDNEIYSQLFIARIA